MRSTALLAMTLVVGCAASEPDLSETSPWVVERLDEPIAWRQSVAPVASAHDPVRALLERELSVEDAVRVALMRNLELQAVYEELGVAEADLLRAALPANPTLHADVFTPDTPPSSTALELEFAVDLVSLLNIPARRSIANAELARTRLQVASRVIELASDVRETYFGLQGALHLRSVVRASGDAAAAGFEYAQALHAAGNASDLQLALQRSLWEDARAEALRAELDVIDQRERLDALMGLWGTETTWTIPERLPDLPAAEVPLQRLEALAVEERLDLAAEQAEVDVASRSLSFSRSWGWMPTIHAGIAADRDSDGGWAVGPSVELPLPFFDRGQADVARFSARVRQSEKRFAARAVEIRAEVRRVRNRLVALRSLVEQFVRGVIPARQQVGEQSLREYNFMLVGTFELLQAKRDELAAYRDCVDSMKDYWTTRAELARVVGGRLPGAQPAQHEGH